LIEEIPLISGAFLETTGVIEQADKFFADLEAKKAKFTPLKNEYRELKDKASQLQRKIDSSSTVVQEIDDQIAQLQSRQAELSSTIETKKKKKIKLASSQAMKANSIRTFGGEIQLAYFKKLEWELKKRNAASRAARILAKFAILKGFPF
jgi:septal ring factor EnvC (AmiA/AmiB activator)